MSEMEPDLMPIGAVVAELQKLHPDLTQSSLRFLEREGLVEPHRSAGGHRLYSSADVQRIRQIKEWQARRLSLAEIRSLLEIQQHAHTAPTLRDVVFDLFLQGRTREAQAVILNADEQGTIDLPAMFRDVITPMLIDVGLLWEAGKMQVSQEKEISEATREVIVELSLRHRSRRNHGPVIVAATVLGELHELGLRMTCGVLGAAGYHVVFLGANVAAEFLAEAVIRYHPAIVLLSSGSDQSFPAVRDAIRSIQGLPLPTMPRILVGGAVAGNHEAELVAWGAIPVVSNDFQQVTVQIGTLLA
ncbi:MAG TPA: MerR family transcriptional regulator [Thermomicrobiales bacterium]|nr:MerR family transcriptional regulator [Thermomicrobiales bacterium]